MKTILVPTDFSEASRNASIYACELAKALQYNILLYHAYHVPVIPPTEVSVTTVIISPQESEMNNKKLIQKEASILAKKSGVKIEHLTTEGFAEDEILRLEKEEKPALIIMGIKKTGTLSEFVMGSVPTDLIRKVQTPVIIVPDKTQFKRIDKIVFAHDLKGNNMTEGEGILKDILQAFSSKIYILNVVKEKKLVEAEAELSEMKFNTHFDNVEPKYHLLEDNDVIHGLNEFIEIHEVDIVTMIPHKHTLLERLFKEPNTKKMAFHTNIPLLTLPEQAF